MPEVSVIIVCMGGPQEYLESCIQRMLVLTKTSLQIIVVAYKWSKENEKRFTAEYPEAILIPSHETRGFAENNNLALPYVQGRYCFIVNDDTRMEEPVIDQLVADLKKLSGSAAAVSPAIRFKDGTLQTCGRGPWTPFRYARHYLHWVDESKRSRWNKVGRRKGKLFKTYTLNGACFLIKSEIFKGIGGFDERYFFTPEDIALGHRLNDMNYTVWADSRVNITHLAGGTVSGWEEAIKPARVRGSMIFYGEPKWLKNFIWLVEVCRWLKNRRKDRAAARVSRNVMKAVKSSQTPKEIFLRFKGDE